jgi:hypothetical protein
LSPGSKVVVFLDFAFPWCLCALVVSKTVQATESPSRGSRNGSWKLRFDVGRIFGYCSELGIPYVSQIRCEGGAGIQFAGLQKEVVGMGSVERTRELRRRRSRKVKLKKLRARFHAATSEADKATINAKAQRVSPLVDFTTEPVVA